jgi:thiol:disulfide interchange protein
VKTWRKVIRNGEQRKNDGKKINPFFPFYTLLFFTHIIVLSFQNCILPLIPKKVISKLEKNAKIV